MEKNINGLKMVAFVGGKLRMELWTLHITRSPMYLVVFLIKSKEYDRAIINIILYWCTIGYKSYTKRIAKKK